MAELQAQTTFTINEPLNQEDATADLLLAPENIGNNALRELHYPGDILQPIIYEQNPDRYTNFDTGPLSGPPIFKGDMTLEGYQMVQWAGYQQDRPIQEIWAGSENRSHITAYFFRRLWEYFANPPTAGFITWKPKDRVDKAYNIVIESLSAGGQDTIVMDYLALQAGFMVGEIILTFRIIGEA